jgi:hypothetical protein
LFKIISSHKSSYYQNPNQAIKEFKEKFEKECKEAYKKAYDLEGANDGSEDDDFKDHNLTLVDID